MQLNIVEIIALIIFLIGVFGLLSNRNIIKSIMCIAIMDIAIILFFIGINYEKLMKPPIGADTEAMADPTVQAIMITAIIIGVAVTAVSLMMFIVLYNRYGTTNWLKASHARQGETK